MPRDRHPVYGNNKNCFGTNTLEPKTWEQWLLLISVILLWVGGLVWGLTGVRQLMGRPGLLQMYKGVQTLVYLVVGLAAVGAAVALIATFAKK